MASKYIESTGHRIIDIDNTSDFQQPYLHSEVGVDVYKRSVTTSLFRKIIRNELVTVVKMCILINVMAMMRGARKGFTK